MSEATKQLDPNKHYSVIFGGKGNDNSLRIRIGCGSEADVFVGQLKGAMIVELEGDLVYPVGAGPLYINCAKHGSFLGMFQVLVKGKGPNGSDPVSMPLLLVPLPGIEHLDPIGTGARLAQQDGLLQQPSG